MASDTTIPEWLQAAIDKVIATKDWPSEFPGIAFKALDLVGVMQATLMQVLIDEVERLRAIVDCCAAECPTDESLEVNERVAVLRAERDRAHRALDLMAAGKLSLQMGWNEKAQAREWWALRVDDGSWHGPCESRLEAALAALEEEHDG